MEEIKSELRETKLFVAAEERKNDSNKKYAGGKTSYQFPWMQDTVLFKARYKRYKWLIFER